MNYKHIILYLAIMLVLGGIITNFFIINNQEIKETHQQTITNDSVHQILLKNDSIIIELLREKENK